MRFCRRFMIFASYFWLLFKLCSSEIYLGKVGLAEGFNIDTSYKPKFDVYMDENNYSFGRPTALFQIYGTVNNCYNIKVKFIDHKSFTYNIEDCIFYSLQSFDYEEPDQRNYTFEVLSSDEEEQNKVNVHLSITNIDDEPPSIPSFQCFLHENILYTSEDSSCHFEIYDADGFLKSMTFTIYSGPDHKDDIFKVAEIPRSLPDTNKSTNASIYNLTPLDFEKKSEYLLLVVANDSGGNRASRIVYVEVMDVWED